MNPKVSRIDLEASSRRFATTFGAESEFRDFVGCSYNGLCEESGRIQMQFMEAMIDESPKTFSKQLHQPKCDYSLDCAAHLHWLH